MSEFTLEEIDDLEECSQMFDFSGFLPEEDRRLITDLKRLKEKEGRGRLLMPLLEWDRDLLDQSLNVLVRLPVEEMHRERTDFIEHLDLLLEHARAIYLRCWESLRR